MVSIRERRVFQALMTALSAVVIDEQNDACISAYSSFPAIPDFSSIDARARSCPEPSRDTGGLESDPFRARSASL